MLLEKPITPTVREAETLLKEADKAGAKVLIGHHRAHSPIMARAKELIDEGRLGQLVAVMGSAVFFKPDEYFADGPWRREAGGGPILLNMIHELHNLRMLCGDIVAVQAFSSRATRGFPVEDTVAINLRFASGALGSFMLSDTAACAHSSGGVGFGSKEIWTMPSRSRRSTKTRPPRLRVRCTQPPSRTRVPTSPARSSPHM